MTHKNTKKLLSQGIIALGVAAWLAPVYYAQADDSDTVYKEFDHGVDDEYEVGVHYEMNPHTGQPVREYAGERSAVEEMAGDFTEDYATVDARITGIRRVDTPQGERLIAKATVDNDRLVVIDFGPSANLAQLDLQEGDNIRVRGLAQGGEDAQLFVAERLQIDGETVALHSDAEDLDVVVID